MNKKLCVLLVLAVLCSTAFAGKSKEKSKEKSNESKEKSDESKSREGSGESSEEAPASTTTDAAEVTDAATDAATDAVTDAATDATTDAATEAVPETEAPAPTANELKDLCKGVVVDMKPHPANCNKFVICVLGKATIQSCGKFQVFNKEVKFCVFGDPKKC